ncbi:MAG: hypothetical protein H0V29_06125, partial [Thermoleophilaceae bacterium]|nr:hypothetical protein [Thermoleophilaceae bacterium]
SRPRKLIGALLALFVVGALAVGLYAGSRQFYFVGTDDQGLVTLYRGLPYDGPFGIEFYSEELATAIPARTLQAAQRERVLDHQLRGKGDATDLVTQIEERRLR